MSTLQNQVAILGKPYSITRSRLGAITKVFQDTYICDLDSLKELFEQIGEKLSRTGHDSTPQFSFLMSFSDRTHQDGISSDFLNLRTLPTGKLTERIVMQWGIIQVIDDMENELSITVRVSNPINPLVFLQAALSKSPNEIDNSEFEMGSTCVTVNGSSQSYADEIFMIIQHWLSARNKPHAFINIDRVYDKFELYIDEMNRSVLPFLSISILSFLSYEKFSPNVQVVVVPQIIGFFFVTRSLADRLNSKMAGWSRKSQYMGLFQITNGDIDNVTKMAAKARNGAFKLISANVITFALNVAAGVLCWWLLPK